MLHAICLPVEKVAFVPGDVYFQKMGIGMAIHAPKKIFCSVGVRIYHMQSDCSSNMISETDSRSRGSHEASNIRTII